VSSNGVARKIDQCTSGAHLQHAKGPALCCVIVARRPQYGDDVVDPVYMLSIPATRTESAVHPVTNKGSLLLTGLRAGSVTVAGLVGSGVRDLAKATW